MSDSKVCPKVLEKYSSGIGDRFAHQAVAQLRACLLAAEKGAKVVPIWNKSNREHLTIGSDPKSTRVAADQAVHALGWKNSYYVDADHIRLDTVDRFLAYSDFYTIDVADSIGQSAADSEIDAFVCKHSELTGEVSIPGVARPFTMDITDLKGIAKNYLLAVKEAGRIYRHIEKEKKGIPFVTEVSMDETNSQQTPVELLVILAAIADEGIPIQTIAPKFTGRFNKGVDYVGIVAQFEQEFSEDISAISLAVKRYGLPANLKLSVHSGSDKFSIYGPIRRSLARTGAGLHIKTAGTTWLEEVIGLAEAGGDGLVLAKEIYTRALEHIDELCAPYAAVIDIDRTKLPSAATVGGWTSEEFVAALRHDPLNPAFNPHLRQLLHVGYKIAATMKDRYLKALEIHEAFVSKNVTDNLYERHLKPLFVP